MSRLEAIQTAAETQALRMKLRHRRLSDPLRREGSFRDSATFNQEN